MHSRGIAAAPVHKSARHSAPLTNSRQNIPELRPPASALRRPFGGRQVAWAPSCTADALADTTERCCGASSLWPRHRPPARLDYLFQEHPWATLYTFNDITL